MLPVCTRSELARIDTLKLRSFGAHHPFGSARARHANILRVSFHQYHASQLMPLIKCPTPPTLLTTCTTLTTMLAHGAHHNART